MCVITDDTRLFLRMAFQRDDPYTMGEQECFIHLETMEVVWAGDGCEPIEEFQNDPSYMVVPGTSHGEWHCVFQDFLDSIGRGSEYQFSIGRLLKYMDEEERYQWYDWKWKYAEKKAEELLDELKNGKKTSHN